MVLDIVMPEMDGIEVLRAIKMSHPDVEVVMASGCGTLETAIEAMRLGAYDYVTKPILNFDEDLLKVVKKALERRRLLDANRRLARDLQEINRELKGSNALLKRRVADLETLYETGRLLGDINGLESLLDVAEATLEHQLGVAHSLIALPTSGEWRIARAAGFGSAGSPDLATTTLSFSDELLADTCTEATEGHRCLEPILELFGVTPEGLPQAVVVPLRAVGEVCGVLLAFSPRSPSDDLVRLLRLFGGQISAPLALAREEVAG